jgi:hypothetical protein
MAAWFVWHIRVWHMRRMAGWVGMQEPFVHHGLCQFQLFGCYLLFRCDSSKEHEHVWNTNAIPELQKVAN